MTIEPPLQLLVKGLKFPEGPRWHAGRLWLSDVHRHEVLSFDAQGRERLEAKLSDRPSGLGFSPAGELLIVGMTERVVFRRGPDGSTVIWGDARHIPGDFLNDMVVGTDGTAWVGCRAHPVADATGNYPPNDLLVVVRPDGSVDVAAEALVTPNGAVVTDGGQRLVVAETRAGRLTGFSIGRNGSLADRHVFAELPGEVPDGICLDAEGAIWVGSPLRGQFLRVREGGEITDRIVTGDRWAVAPAIGGADGHTLFLLSTAITLEALMDLKSPADDIRSPGEGRVYVTTVPVPAARH